MSKTKASATTVAFTSLKDSAFQQAGAAKTLEDVARFVMSKVPGFPENISDEAKAELYEGYKMKYDNLHPAKVYAVISDHYVEATPEHLSAKTVEKVDRKSTRLNSSHT